MHNSVPSTDFLPMSRAEMEARGWDEVDFVFVTGDAYVDHPSFATALLGRCWRRKGSKSLLEIAHALNNSRERKRLVHADNTGRSRSRQLLWHDKNVSCFSPHLA